MDESIQQVAAALHRLIQMNRDGQEGYSEAAERVKPEALRVRFHQYSAQRGRFITELNTLLDALNVGVNANTSTTGTLGGSFQRMWMNVRTALAGVPYVEVIVLEAIEHAEDSARATYESAFEIGLPEGIGAVIQRQYEQVLEAHHHIRDLRDAYRAIADNQT